MRSASGFSAMGSGLFSVGIGTVYRRRGLNLSCRPGDGLGFRGTALQ